MLAVILAMMNTGLKADFAVVNPLKNSMQKYPLFSKKHNDQFLIRLCIVLHQKSENIDQF